LERVTGRWNGKWTYKGQELRRNYVGWFEVRDSVGRA
jgi:hypothetical protein